MSRSLTRRGLLTSAVGVGGALAGSSLLAACGDNSGGLGGGSTGGKVTELVVATASSPWLGEYRKIVAGYEAASGVRITLREFPFDGLFTQQANAVQQKSNAFDLFQINEGWTAQFYDKKWVRPLAEIDPDFTIDPGIAEYDGLGRWDAAKKVTSSDAPLMALPLNGNIHVLAYRKDVYAKLGLQPPTTFDEAIANGRKAVEAGEVKYGYTTRGQGTPGGSAVTFDFVAVLKAFGGNYFADPGTDWTPIINNDAAQAAMATFLELLKLGPAQPQTLGQAEVIAALQSGSALQGHLVVAAAAQFEDAAKSQVAGRMGYTVCPAGPRTHAPVSGAWTIGVPSTLPDDRAKAALDFMTWLLSKEVQLKWGRAGGVITRSDVLDELAQDPKMEAMKAVRDSLPYIVQNTRYVFAQQLLQSTEINLSKVVSGSVSPKAGLDTIAADLKKAVAESGL